MVARKLVDCHVRLRDTRWPLRLGAEELPLRRGVPARRHTSERSGCPRTPGAPSRGSPSSGRRRVRCGPTSDQCNSPEHGHGNLYGCRRESFMTASPCPQFATTAQRAWAATSFPERCTFIHFSASIPGRSLECVIPPVITGSGVVPTGRRACCSRRTRPVCRVVRAGPDIRAKPVVRFALSPGNSSLGKGASAIGGWGAKTNTNTKT